MIDEELLSGKRPYDNADEYKELLDLARWALLHAKPALEQSEPMLRRWGCSPSGDHDDPSWCTPKCGDYGRTARKALEAFPKVEE